MNGWWDLDNVTSNDLLLGAELILQPLPVLVEGDRQNREIGTRDKSQ